MTYPVPSTVWRDFSTDGDPGSGKHNPEKSLIREWAMGIHGGRLPLASDIASLSFSADVTMIRTAGYAAYGDGGGAAYVEVGSAPTTHNGYKTDADGRFWELYFDGMNTPPQFGADWTGTTACDDAIDEWVRYCIAKQQGLNANRGVRFYVGPGVFLCTSDNPVQGASWPTSQTIIVGATLEGCGEEVTIFHYKPSTGSGFAGDNEHYFLDGGTTTTASEIVFQGLNVVGLSILLDHVNMTSGEVIGAKRFLGGVSGTAYETNTKWERVRVSGIDDGDNGAAPPSGVKVIAIDFVGSINADSNTFNACVFRHMTHVARTENAQAVGNFFHGSHGISLYGDVIVSRSNGALEYYWFGGSIVWTSAAAGDTLTGTHTGANNASALTDSGASFTSDLIGCLITNDTDGSWGIVRNQTATTITTTLSGGTDNDFDTSDAYTVHYPVAFVNVDTTSSSLGPTNSFAGFYGVKCEMNGRACGLVDATSTGGTITVKFEGMNLVGGSVDSDGPRPGVRLGPDKTVMIERCSVPNNFVWSFTTSSAVSGNYSTKRNHGLVYLDRCGLKESPSGKYHTALGTNFGRVKVSNAYQFSGSAPSTHEGWDMDTAADFWLISNAEPGVELKTKNIVQRRVTMSAADTASIVLAAPCRIKAVTLFVPGAGATATSRDTTITDGDANTLLTVSGAEDTDQMGTADLTTNAQGLQKLRETTNECTLTVTMDASLTTSRTGVWATVEYY